MSIPRATIHVRCRHGPARAGHAAPLHRVHPWGVGDPSLASQPMQRAHSGDAGGLRRDIAAAAHTHKSSGSPGPPCSGDWSMIYFPVASGGTPSRPILTAEAPGSSPSGLLRLSFGPDGETAATAIAAPVLFFLLRFAATGVTLQMTASRSLQGTSRACIAASTGVGVAGGRAGPTDGRGALGRGRRQTTFSGGEGTP